MQNFMEIEGFIKFDIKFSTSPSGVIHSVFFIEHQSIRQENNLNRKAYCLINVVASGKDINQKVKNLVEGVKVKVCGFLTNKSLVNGSSRLVLHAENIEII